MAEKKLKVIVREKRKKKQVTQSGFYYARNEQKEKNRVFVFYAYADSLEILAHIPREVVEAELKEGEQ